MSDHEQATTVYDEPEGSTTTSPQPKIRCPFGRGGSC